MRVHSSTRYIALVALAGALACAGNKAQTDDSPEPEQSGAARDTTTENPPGYRGMERDTAISPTGQPSDTFLQNQGTGQAQDTAGYSGMERVDTTGQAGQTDTSGYNANPTGTDTTAMPSDTSGASSGAAGLDSTGMSESGDTTGYQPSQQPQDTTTSP
jgi:hypothetical protein